MKKSLTILLLTGLAISQFACGGSTKAQVKELNNINLDLPAGWTVTTDNYGGGAVAEVSAKGMRVLKISEAKNKAESLEMLEKAMAKDTSAINKETLANGFGGTFEKKSGGKKFPVYVINVGDKTYNCEAGAYYDEKYLEEAVKVCKSIG